MFVVSYNGVHQAFQLALAAEESALLHKFLCSIYDSPWKVGWILSRVLGEKALHNRRLEGIPASKVKEHPQPELRFKLRSKLKNLPSNAWINTFIEFDQWAARQPEILEAKGIISAEVCALETFRAAKKTAKITVYDCPGYNADLWRANAKTAAQLSGLPFVSASDSPQITERKIEELSLSDYVLTYSDFHSQGIVDRGVPRSRIIQIPLWTDPVFWKPKERNRLKNSKLKILFVGGINLRKGVPLLINAARIISDWATLTMVGKLDTDVLPCFKNTESFITCIPPVTKDELRNIYNQHDILVLPSLGDSFGFVAMEAMACGLPVILTTHCGAPVPDKAWRVPILDSEAILARLRYYLDNRDQLIIDGEIARRFSESYTPARYRNRIGDLLKTLTAGEVPKTQLGDESI